jgi:hypothetical protein
MQRSTPNQTTHGQGLTPTHMIWSSVSRDFNHFWWNIEWISTKIKIAAAPCNLSITSCFLKYGRVLGNAFLSDLMATLQKKNIMDSQEFRTKLTSKWIVLIWKHFFRCVYSYNMYTLLQGPKQNSIAHTGGAATNYLWSEKCFYNIFRHPYSFPHVLYAVSGTHAVENFCYFFWSFIACWRPSMSILLHSRSSRGLPLSSDSHNISPASGSTVALVHCLGYVMRMTLYK